MRLVKTFLLILISAFIISCDIGKEGSVPKPEINIFEGKTILWVGTSIAAKYGDNSYPKQIGRNLKASVINNSIFGGKIISYAGDSITKPILGLSGTAFEHQHYGPYSSAYSYTVNIENHLSKADFVVIDYSHNDTSFMPGRLGTISSTDKSTLYGAFNWVIDEIQKTKPEVRIILCTPPNGFLWGGVEPSITNFRTVTEAVRQIGIKRGFPVFDMMAAKVITGENVLLTTTDGIHPTQVITDSLAKLGAKFFLGIK